MTLAAFLQGCKDREFAMASYDCGMFVCEWMSACTGRDVYAPWRGRYQTGFGAARIILKTGGVPALLAEIAEVAGWAPCEPRKGVVGAVPIINGAGQADIGMAICTGRLWATCGKKGVVMLTAEPLVCFGPA